MDLLATTALLTRLEDLQGELNRIEHQMTETNPHSDQAILDDAWTAITREMDELNEILGIDEANRMEDARDLIEFAETGYCGFPCNYGCPTCSVQYDPNDEL